MKDLTSTILAKVNDCLKATIRPEPNVHGHNGWGRYKDQPLSIVNTVEALLAMRETGILGEYLQNAESVKKFLREAVPRFAQQEQVHIRYISYGAVGLELIGETALSQTLIRRLLETSLSQGWPCVSNERTPGLISTFQAVFALQELGQPVEEAHYDFLASHRRSDNLCFLSRSDCSPSLGASSLILYLLTRDRRDYSHFPRDIALVLPAELASRFRRMRTTHNWWEVDPETNFRIHGFGFGLRALQQLNMLDLRECGAGDFVEALSMAMNALDKVATDPSLACDPNRSWIPAVLEIALAVRTIQSVHDPLGFCLALKKQDQAEPDSLREKERSLLDLRKQILLEEREVFRQKSLVEEVVVSQNASVRIMVDTVAQLEKQLTATLARRLVYGIVTIFLALLTTGFGVLLITRPVMGQLVSGLVTLIGTILTIGSFWLAVRPVSQVQRKTIAQDD